MEIRDFYGQRAIQKALLGVTASREVAVKYGDRGFGRRPDILQYEGDISELARQGAPSFHISEERWLDPLQLKAGMTKADLDRLRIGWDCLLDVDSPSFECSRIATELLL